MARSRELSKIFSSDTLVSLDNEIQNNIIIQAESEQTDNLLELRNSSGSVVSSIGPTGALGGTIGDIGLVRINETTFSGVASQSLPNGTFTSTYDSYLIEARYTATGLGSLRLRLNGTDADGATDYKHQVQGVYGTGTRLDGGSTGASSVAWFASVNSGTQIVYVKFWLNGISSATPTTGVGLTIFNDGVNRHVRNGNFWHDLSIAYDSLTLINTGTMSGNMRVYGYKR